MASTAENEATVHTSPEILATCDFQERVQSTEDQGVQGTSSLPSSSEPMALRAASSANHSEVVHENGVLSPNISYGLSTPIANNPPRHLFNDPYEYELEKIRIEEENLKKSVEELTSQLMAELDKKMAEAQNEFDRVSQEFDAACKAKVMEVEAHMSLVRPGSLLANAFMSKCSERSASNDLAAVRAMISQQQQAVHMNSTVPPRARPQQAVQASTHMSNTSITSVEAPIPNSSGPLPQQTVQAHRHVNSTAPPPPPVTSVEPQTPSHLRPLVRIPRPITALMSKQAVAQSNTNVNSTAIARPSEAPPLHSPLSNTPRPKPRPVISNLTPSSSPAVQGTGRGPAPHVVRGPAPHIVRASAPHLARRPAPHLRQYGSSAAPMSAAPTIQPTRSVQEQEQQQGKSKDGLVHLSDDD